MIGKIINPAVVLLCTAGVYFSIVSIYNFLFVEFNIWIAVIMFFSLIMNSMWVVVFTGYILDDIRK